MTESLIYINPRLRLVEKDTKLLSVPTLESVLADKSLVVKDSALFGMATDGLPCVLHLRDPRPGPILILGNRGCGATTLLQCIGRSALRLSSQTGLVVMTNSPDEWEPEERVIVLDDHRLQPYLLDFVKTRQRNNKIILLLVDGIEIDPGVLQELCQAGPIAGLWPIVVARTMQPGFRTVVFGHSFSSLQTMTLKTGSFLIKEREKLLQFSSLM